MALLGREWIGLWRIHWTGINLQSLAGPLASSQSSPSYFVITPCIQAVWHYCRCKRAGFTALLYVRWNTRVYNHSFEYAGMKITLASFLPMFPLLILLRDDESGRYYAGATWKHRTQNLGVSVA